MKEVPEGSGRPVLLSGRRPKILENKHSNEDNNKPLVSKPYKNLFELDFIRVDTGGGLYPWLDPYRFE